MLFVSLLAVLALRALPCVVATKQRRSRIWLAAQLGIGDDPPGNAIHQPGPSLLASIQTTVEQRPRA
ncbi:MAG TPA: hypothetical protein VFG30_13080 [Polyangiales bacterium]|nr:hypothetical protein [Polyangiales bacterium]